jgi:hypothetical protein
LRTLVALSEQPGLPVGSEFARAAAAAAAIGTWLGDYSTARRMGELSVAAWASLDNLWGFADAVGTLAFATIEVDPQKALGLNEQSLRAYREIGDIAGEGQALLGRATPSALGGLSETRETLERSLHLLRQAGDEYFALFCSIFLGRVKLLMGEVWEVSANIGTCSRRHASSDSFWGSRLGSITWPRWLCGLAMSRGVFGSERLPVASRTSSEAESRRALAAVSIHSQSVANGCQLKRSSRVAAGRAMDIDSAVDDALEVEPPAQVMPT